MVKTKTKTNKKKKSEEKEIKKIVVDEPKKIEEKEILEKELESEEDFSGNLSGSSRGLRTSSLTPSNIGVSQSQENLNLESSVADVSTEKEEKPRTVGEVYSNVRDKYESVEMNRVIRTATHIPTSASENPVTPMRQVRMVPWQENVGGDRNRVYETKALHEMQEPKDEERKRLDLMKYEH